MRHSILQTLKSNFFFSFPSLSPARVPSQVRNCCQCQFTMQHDSTIWAIKCTTFWHNFVIVFFLLFTQLNFPYQFTLFIQHIFPHSFQSCPVTLVYQISFDSLPVTQETSFSYSQSPTHPTPHFPLTYLWWRIFVLIWINFSDASKWGGWLGAIKWSDSRVPTMFKITPLMFSCLVSDKTGFGYLYLRHSYLNLRH